MPVVKDFDARLYEDGNASKFYLVFCARRSVGQTGLPGHAYVVWGKEDAAAQLSSQEAFGFYNNAASPIGVVLGRDVPGELRDEAVKPAPSQLVLGRLIVQILQADYELARAEQVKWHTEDYNLYKRNCISFASAVAGVIGLRGIPPEVAEWPADYFVSLADQAKSRSTGRWKSSDAAGRFVLDIAGPAVQWTERSVTGSLTKSVIASAGPQANSCRIERPNTNDVLGFLGFLDATLRAEILAAGPQPSYLILRFKDGSVEGEWHGLLVKKKANGRLEALVQPSQVPAKMFTFAI